MAMTSKIHMHRAFRSYGHWKFKSVPYFEMRNSNFIHIIRLFIMILMTTAVLPTFVLGETLMAAAQERKFSDDRKNAHGKADATHCPSQGISLFLCGDVMTGRGIDQIMPHSVDPVIHESYMRNAKGYVQLAEKASGPIPKPVAFDYIWGDALSVLEEINPDLRIINLETSVTTSDDFRPKGINYRMHPDNIACLSAAAIDCCILANNHVLDWGHKGLAETLDVLSAQGLRHVGAGKDSHQAKAPAVFQIIGKGRLIIFAYGSKTSGIPYTWAASDYSPGINMLPDLSIQTIRHIKKEVAAIKQPGDVVLMSLHWGGNWGYGIAKEERRFAHKLIDEAGIDAVYGHSSHHVKGIEVYRQKLILYGCGDFLNDYEGIQGYEQYRSHLTLMYFPCFDPMTGRLLQMRMMPMQIKRFQTTRAIESDNRWLSNLLNREGRPLGTGVKMHKDGSFRLVWKR